MIDRLKTGLERRAARNFARKSLPIRLERPIVSFCFDDVPTSAWDVGGAILARHGVNATYYVAGGLCGTVFNGNSILPADRLSEIVNAGHEIGSHGWDHQSTRDLDVVASQTQFDDNEAFIASWTSQERTSTFAYPYGELSVRSKRTASNRFAACRGVWQGLNHGIIDLGLLSSVCLEPHILEANPVKNWIRLAVDRRGWLIFTTHDVDENPTPFGITPRLLDEAVSAAIDAGCDVLPVRNALSVCAFEEG